MTESVTIFLTAPDAELFREFQRNHENIQRIVASGALGLRNTTFTCHIDGEGMIKRVDTLKTLFTS